MPLKVYFELPAQIALGLASGRLERVGGIIRDAASKKIVAWLRESGQLVFSDPELTTGFLQVLQKRSGGLAAVATGVLDAAVTARSHHLLMREMHVIQRLSRLAVVTGVLNLGLGAISFVTMVDNANHIAELVKSEAERDRTIERESVIEYLGMLKHLSDDRQNVAAQLAVLPVLKARKNLLRDFEDLLSAGRLTSSQTHGAIHCLVSTMQLDILHVRSYLDTDQLNAAKSRLKQCVNDYRMHVRTFVEKLLGEFPAMYFNKDVSKEDFQRYLLIEEWLRGKHNILLELIEERRYDFWNGKAIGALSPGLLDAIKSDKPIDHLTALTMAELLIEYLQRLEGYELEIATLRMSVQEWDRLTDLEEHDFAAIVDLEMLDELMKTG